MWVLLRGKYWTHANSRIIIIPTYSWWLHATLFRWEFQLSKRKNLNETRYIPCVVWIIYHAPKFKLANSLGYSRKRTIWAGTDRTDREFITLYNLQMFCNVMQLRLHIKAVHFNIIIWHLLLLLPLFQHKMQNILQVGILWHNVFG